MSSKNWSWEGLQKEVFNSFTLIHMAMASDKPSLHSFGSHFQENKATTIKI